MSTLDAEPTAVSGTELASFTRQLGAMLHAGVNVLRALRIASQYTGNSTLIETARSLASALEDGKELHQALSRHPDIFDPFYVEMTRQGEADGTLGQTLLGVADYLDHLTPPDSVPGEPGTTLAAAASPSAGTSRPLLTTFGILALGVACLGALVAAELISDRWYLPLASAWAGFCLLAAARHTAPAQSESHPAAFLRRPTTPRKSAQRRAAETDGIVRNALQEQEEEAETQPNGVRDHLSNASRAGFGPDLLLPPDERKPPRFEL